MVRRSGVLTGIGNPDPELTVDGEEVNEIIKDLSCNFNDPDPRAIYIFNQAKAKLQHKIAQEANKARIDELTIFPMALSAAEYIAYKTKRRAVLNIRLTAEKGKA